MTVTQPPLSSETHRARLLSWALSVMAVMIYATTFSAVDPHDEGVVTWFFATQATVAAIMTTRHIRWSRDTTRSAARALALTLLVCGAGDAVLVRLPLGEGDLLYVGASYVLAPFAGAVVYFLVATVLARLGRSA